MFKGLTLVAMCLAAVTLAAGEAHNPDFDLQVSEHTNAFVLSRNLRICSLHLQAVQ